MEKEFNVFNIILYIIAGDMGVNGNMKYVWQEDHGHHLSKNQMEILVL